MKNLEVLIRVCARVHWPLLFALSHAGLLHAQPAVTIIPIDGLGGFFVTPMALNNRGEVAGVSYTADNSAQHAFLYNGAGYVDLGTLGGSFSGANALNQVGQVTGDSYTANDAQSHAFRYTSNPMEDLGTLGGTFSTGVAINDSGVVAGDSYTVSGADHAFRFGSGGMSDLGTLGGNRSSAVALNNAGQVAGNSTLPGERQTHAFLYTTSLQDLGTLGGASSFASGINDLGAVVGDSDTALRQTHAFLYQNNAMSDLGTLGGTHSTAYAINQTGQVIGDANTAGNAQSHAFLYSGGQMNDLGTLGGTYSTAYALNNAGHVVGDSANSAGVSRAFLYKDGTMLDLNTFLPPGSGWDLYSAQFINDAGQIMGLGIYNGAFGWFLMTPVSAVNQPPVADAGEDQTVECQGDVSLVHLDGRQSRDPEGETLSFAWFEGETLLGSTAELDVHLPFGSHTIRLEVKDPENNSDDDTLTVEIVDTKPPTILCPGDLRLEAGNNCSAPVPDLLSGATVSDDCSGPSGLRLEQNPPAGTLLALGEHLVELSATDQAGNRAACGVMVTVVDATPPIVECPAPLELSAGSACDAVLPNLLPGVKVSDNCSSTDGILVSQNPPAGTLLGIGTHTVVITAQDSAGNVASCNALVTVVDREPPKFVSLTVSPDQLSPANKQMVPVQITAQVSDNCDPNPQVQLISITSSEPVTDQADKTSPDWEITGPLTANLRAERSSKGDGRIYTLTVRTTDASGNSATSSVVVTVPKGKN